ncbi:MAG: hypothetical protein IPP29_03525 [Bacteroidetes bacterium]|nr:hypothetical protein [Bacteroidota bacterium]
MGTANIIRGVGIGTFPPGITTNSALHVNTNFMTTSINYPLINFGEVFRTDGPAGVTHAWRMLSNNGTAGEKFNILNPSGTDNINMGTVPLGDFNFFTNNTQRMTILGNGLVGIGTPLPTNQLQVNGAALSTVFRTDNNAGVAPLWSMFKGATNIGNLYGNGGANNIFNVEANMADLYLWGRGNNAGTNNALQPRLIVSNGNQVNAAAAIIVPNVTKIGINYDPAVGLTVPQTALHIGPNMQAGIGYQTWMDLGTLYNNGCHMYTGMKLENSNRYDAVINWGNDLAGVGGPDFLRFIFTQIGGGAPTAGQAFDGEEVARFAPTGNTGLGNFWAYGANTLPNRRLELLDANPNSTTRANQDLPQLRLTYLYNPIVTSGIWTDFQTQNNGNLQINTSNDELPQRVGINNGTAALTRTFDVNGNLRLRTLPQAQFNANGNAAINRVMVANASGEVFWRDDIGPGGAGIITADNGLSRTPNNSNVQLGQIVGAGGSPGRLLHKTEIPMNNYDVYFPEPAFPNGGNRVAIGTVTPLGKFHVQKSGPVFLNTVHYAGYFVNSEQSSSDGYGIHVETTGANKNNTAGEFKASNGIGGNTGVYAEGVSTSSNSVGGNFYASTTNSLAIGLRAEGSGGVNVFGIDASAINGTNFNYGIIATGGTNCTMVGHVLMLQAFLMVLCPLLMLTT